MFLPSPSFALLFGSMLALAACSKPKDLQYVDFQNLKVEEWGFDKSKVKVDLRYYNPNRFDLQLKEADVNIFINNELAGHGILDSLITLPARDTFAFPLIFETDMQNLIKNTWHAGLQNEVTLKIVGKCKLGRTGIFFPFPIHYESREKLPIF